MKATTGHSACRAVDGAARKIGRGTVRELDRISGSSVILISHAIVQRLTFHLIVILPYPFPESLMINMEHSPFPPHQHGTAISAVSLWTTSRPVAPSRRQRTPCRVPLPVPRVAAAGRRTLVVMGIHFSRSGLVMRPLAPVIYARHCNDYQLPIKVRLPVRQRRLS